MLPSGMRAMSERRHRAGPSHRNGQSRGSLTAREAEAIIIMLYSPRALCVAHILSGAIYGPASIGMGPFGQTTSLRHWPPSDDKPFLPIRRAFYEACWTEGDVRPYRAL